MPFKHDSTGIDPMNTMPLMPDGWYTLKIMEAEEQKSKNGNDMILCKCRPVNEPNYQEIEIWHYVVFIPKGNKGDGISVWFRKCIEVPYGGNDVIDADDWVGKKFKAYVVQSTYDGKTRNKIDRVESLNSKVEQDDNVPF